MMHQQVPATRTLGQGWAITALVLGLAALVFTCGEFGWLPGVPGFIIGMVALNKYQPGYSAPNMRAIAGWGIALSIIASLVSLALLIVNTQPH